MRDDARDAGAERDDPRARVRAAAPFAAFTWMPASGSRRRKISILRNGKSTRPWILRHVLPRSCFRVEPSRKVARAAKCACTLRYCRYGTGIIDEF